MQSVEIEYKDLFLYRVDSKEGLRRKKVSRLLLSVTLSFSYELQMRLSKRRGI